MKDREEKRAIGISCIIIGIFLVGIILIVSWGIGTRNDIVRLQNNVEFKQSKIETALQRRENVIPNIVSTVKGYAKHEEDVYKAIADARSKMASASNITDESKASNDLSSALNRLLGVVEKYPELQANEDFKILIDELEGSENRIRVARDDYNSEVKKYNDQILLFPDNIIASMFNYQKIDTFKADDSAKDAPVVSFD